MIWDKVFKNGQSKFCGGQPLKIFTWSIFEYFVPFMSQNCETLNIVIKMALCSML